MRESTQSFRNRGSDGKDSPPTGCGEPGSWAAVTLNFTVTSNGTQYDRLATFTFQHTESMHFFIFIMRLGSRLSNSLAHFNARAHARRHHLDLHKGRDALHSALFEARSIPSRA